MNKYGKLIFFQVGLMHKGRLLVSGVPKDICLGAGMAPGLEEAFLRLCPPAGGGGGLDVNGNSGNNSSDRQAITSVVVPSSGSRMKITNNIGR